MAEFTQKEDRCAQIPALAGKQRDDVLDRVLHRLAGAPSGAWETSQQTTRVACSPRSGNCTPTMPRALQTMPQRPIAASNSA